MNSYPKLKNKTVLITGGAGFIGSNLCDSFFEAGNKVRCFDDLSTGFEENIAHLKKEADFAFIKGDIRNMEHVKEAVKGVDIILHQAALGSVPRSINDPITTNGVNIDGFLNVIHAAKEAGIKRVVYAASSSTYGDSKELPKVEDRIGMPLSPYAVTKYVNELYAHVYGNLFDIELIGLRYFNVFGKRQTPDGAYAAAIPRFIKSFMSGEEPTVHGDGLQTRDFTYIKNVIQINHLAAVTTNPRAVNQVYNVAFGERTRVIELIELIRRSLLQFDPSISDAQLNFGPSRAGDVKDSLADISKARDLLNFEPGYSLEDGIVEAIAWYWNSLKD
ncbi:MAG: SDR family oxidoreductase [Cryomorphaceae bacterium]